jgi:8-oxo-dGTP diphosphatase
METESSKKEYYDSFPRKRSAVGVLIFENEKLLALQPTYKNNWVVPGGVVEKAESPFEAAIRECKEELGVEVEIESFLCVDYKRGNPEIGDAVHFLFLGKIKKSAEIKLDPSEIQSYIYLTTKEALAKFDSHLANRVQSGLTALKEGRSYYCEDGRILC